MNVRHFYTALRYIAISQNQGPGITLTKEVLKNTATLNYGPPKFNIPGLATGAVPSAPVPPAAAATGTPNAFPHANNSFPAFQPPMAAIEAAGQPGSFTPSSVDPGAQYAITPADHAGYHKIFVQYDTNKDGFLSEPEAIAVLSKSNVSREVLQAIYTLADSDKDTRLSSKEFCLAFHLTLCVT